ncbi:helix-turn-helix transcriptional regulator [Listeria booriae]|uniref:Helix-turn-helix transcriptional regulator n=1 Tax=Listeria booriae TaxID=1552123 RepID=A0A7X0WSP5_9LIST|nr:helix-turn-helix transcriptional regulator [Listeria booriae]MBC1359070.1 helix-turn-helix transcriptional regulator [Listeria booriae]MBC1491565.1 helix-turn-helix transcriptional regulator [Listeria booriae]MBC1502344.1 helix-turn-helix transcriptional regulator [Listeria booriae]MBC1523412.1 helix-turn-helix transcriptional regulator [Listeria booriae]MBC1529809.1 helix-turn-helix transcriptional regulator [Listeria booriae]
MPDLSKRLTILREKQGWSKAETARRLGLKAPSTYGNWEYGIREPDLDTVRHIATLFDVSVDYLIGQNSEPSYKPVTTKEKNDIAKRLEKITEDLRYEEHQHLNGEYLQEETTEYIIDSLEFTLKQAKKMNN